MAELSFFIRDLSNRALEKNDQELVEKINSEAFKEELKASCEVFKALGLQVVKPGEDKRSYRQEIEYRISQVLEKTFFSIFYININTNKYFGYGSNEEFKNLNIDKEGDDFFTDIISNMKKVVYYKDQEKILNALSKENLIKETKNGKTFSVIHRLIINGKEKYIEIKAFADTTDEGIVLGLSDIDEQKTKELKYKHQMEENSTYLNIALSLVQNYFTVYYVDVTNSSYIEYSINSDHQKLEYVSSGTDFFADSKVNAFKYIVNEDQEKFLHAIERENMLNEINNGKIFTLSYRQLINNVPTHVQFTAINLINDKSHVILAVSNIDNQKKKDEEYIRRLEIEKKLARTDALTGVKNKYSYNECTAGIESAIINKKSIEFGILICDINDLKLINDTLGHEAGDKIIIKATELLTSTFKNSSVYRVGGDEFAVIIEGSDYYKIEHLIKNIIESNKKSKNINDLVLAWGFSIFDRIIDHSVTDVFSRADENMYEKKRYLKSIHKY